MKYGSLFSGIGGFDLGFDQTGMACAWQVEKDEAAQSVLKKTLA
jgi:DNA (cytosine-5)-methyltransferase 1